MINSRLSLSLSSALLALCALPLVGCAGGEDADPIVADPSAPITTIELANGNQVEFYEPAPGMLMVSELGTAGVTPLPAGKKSPVELYRELAPGKAVPAALIAAQARSEELPLSAAPTVEIDDAKTSTSANVVDDGTRSFIDNESCDDYWFNNNFCVGSYDWSLCLLNHWNGAYASLSSVDYVHHAVCADIGNITLKIKMGDDTGGTWTVLQGQYRTWSWRDNCVFGCNESTRGDVLNASGDRFHYAVRANY